VIFFSSKSAWLAKALVGAVDMEVSPCCMGTDFN